MYKEVKIERQKETKKGRYELNETSDTFQPKKMKGLYLDVDSNAL